MTKKYKKHLAEILIEVGMINPIAMGNLLSRHRQTREPLSSILISSGLTTQKLLSYVMEQEYEFKHIDMERYTVPLNVTGIFTDVKENIEKGLPVELLPVSKEDFDTSKWLDSNIQEDSSLPRKSPVSLTIVAEDDFYNYVIDSRKVCMMCMNPLVIKNADMCYRLKKLSDKKSESIPQVN